MRIRQTAQDVIFRLREQGNRTMILKDPYSKLTDALGHPERVLRDDETIEILREMLSQVIKRSSLPLAALAEGERRHEAVQELQRLCWMAGKVLVRTDGKARDEKVRESDFAAVLSGSADPRFYPLSLAH